jgi:Glycosyltransferase family 87
MTTAAHDSETHSVLFRLADKGSWLFALGGAALLIAVGVLGIGKPASNWMSDFYWYHAGGKCFLLGSNMYDLACVRGQLAGLTEIVPVAGLAYPPHFAPIALVFGALPLGTAIALFTAFGLLAAVATAILAMSIDREPADSARPMRPGLLAAIILANSGIWAVLWLGQITLVLGFFLWAGFLAVDRDRPVLGGILLALVSVKPQIALLAFVWLVLNGRVKVLTVAAATALVLSTYAFAVMGPLPAVQGWLTGMATYQDYSVNQLGEISVDGIPSILALFGITVPILIATAIGVLAVVVLRFTNRSPPFSALVLATLVAIQMLIFSRPIDTLLFAPAFAVFWPRADWQSSEMLLFAAAVALFCIPQSVVTALIPSEIAQHFRTLFFVPVAVMLYRQAMRGGRRVTWQSGRPTPLQRLPT